MSVAVEQRLRESGIRFELNSAVQTTLLRSCAELIISPKNIEQIHLTLSILKELEREFHIHGCGSKSLMMGTEENPLKTAVIRTKQLNKVGINKSRGVIIAQPGASISKTSRLSAEAQLTGLEFATDIPGSTAGAIATDAWHPVHNYYDLFEEEGVEFSELTRYLREILKEICLIDDDGNEQILTADQLKMNDRKSILLDSNNSWFLINAVFQLAQGDPEEINKSRQIITKGRERMRSRNEKKNPFSVKSTLGYTFIPNHSDYGDSSAAELIATTGSLPKTIRADGMIHSTETPNIIANEKDGAPNGYLRIMDIIREAVLAEHCVELPIEIGVVN